METNRRNFIKTTMLAGLGTLTGSAGAATWLHGDHGFALPALGYGFDALEPFIDAQTMQIHHGKHHQAYVTKLNEAIEKEPSLKGKSLDELMKGLSSVPEGARTSIRNQGGGHWNHSFFWPLLKKDTRPSGKLKEAIVRDFGSMENMTSAFEKAALGQFGSGWAWLVSRDGQLAISATPNQDNPLMDLPGILKAKPVFGLDVWEHAYYLKYQNRRGDYAKAFWNVLNWDQAEKNYTGA